MVNNIFSVIPENLEAEVFEQLLASNGVTIERIISKGHHSPEMGWYDQDSNEWVMVLKGQAVLLFADGSRVTMAEGDFVNIQAHTRHKVEWTTPEMETIWLAVHY